MSIDGHICNDNGHHIKGILIFPTVKYKGVGYIEGNERHGLVDLHDHHGKYCMTVRKIKGGYRKI